MKDFLIEWNSDFYKNISNNSFIENRSGTWGWNTTNDKERIFKTF